jgi:hypothetical protein
LARGVLKPRQQEKTMSRATAPTPKQISYLKSLAEQTETSFTYPNTPAQASREIERLLALKESGGRLVGVEEETDGQTSLARELDEQDAIYATAAQPGEVSGYGSTASWYKPPENEPAAATPRQLSYLESLAEQTGESVEPPETREEASRTIDRLLALKRSGTPPEPATANAGARPTVAGRVELARYTISDAERVLYEQRVNGAIRLTDRPATGEGRSYLVECELQQDGDPALKALVIDYIDQARKLDEIPMASNVIRRELEQLGVAA